MITQLDKVSLWSCPDENGNYKEYIVRVGEMIYDDLTRDICKILKIDIDDKCMTPAVWIDHEYLGGGRFLWEINSLEERKDNGFKD